MLLQPLPMQRASTSAGGVVDGSIVLEGTITYLAPPRRAPFRGTWTPLPDGQVPPVLRTAVGGGGVAAAVRGFYRREGEGTADDR